jgi:hypothetical protein
MKRTRFESGYNANKKIVSKWIVIKNIRPILRLEFIIYFKGMMNRDVMF